MLLKVGKCVAALNASGWGGISCSTPAEAGVRPFTLYIDYGIAAQKFSPSCSLSWQLCTASRWTFVPRRRVAGLERQFSPGRRRKQRRPCTSKAAVGKKEDLRAEEWTFGCWMTVLQGNRVRGDMRLIGHIRPFDAAPRIGDNTTPFDLPTRGRS